jgi:ring-1,2-phenylacetyl-CoA epoxidase subunit PaaC
MSHQTHIDYTLHLADNALVLGHRNSEWTGRGPILEQDIALSNIALDLIGQARYFYQHAARCINEKGARPLNDRGAQPLKDSVAQPLNDGGEGHQPEVTEDSLAYGRDGWDFRNCLLVELEGGDWAKTILRQFFFSVYQAYYYERLRHSRDTELSAIAEKALKEVTYHLRWSSEWVIRLGDGTAESHHRMELALDQLWSFTGELFIPADYERSLVLSGIAVDPELVRPLWEEKVGEVFREAQLSFPQTGGGEMKTVGGGTQTGSGWMQTGGKQGRHTEDLGYLLAEMQFLQRAYPGCEW